MATLPVVIIIVIVNGETEKREAKAIAWVPVVITRMTIIIVIAGSPVPVPAFMPAEPAIPLAAVPAVHLLHQTVVELHCAQASIGKATGEGARRGWACR